MKFLPTFIILAIILVLAKSADPNWSFIPSLRAGQIEPVTSLMTADDTSPSSTQFPFTFTDLTSSVSLQSGISLISYQSWMTDTFSFNISLINVLRSSATLKFLVLDNTFFTKAKVHYIVIWRSSANIGGSSAGAHYYDMQVIHGCYLTDDLLLSPSSNRSELVGGYQTSQVSTNALATQKIVVKSMICGIQLSNSVGQNNQVKIVPSIVSNKLFYLITAQENNMITFFCVSTIIYNEAVTYNRMKYVIQYKTLSLTPKSGLEVIKYMKRYDGVTDRMFFGFSQFNLSMSDTRFLHTQTSNISLVSLLYLSNAAMNQVLYHTFFFAERTCNPATQYYWPTLYTCVVDASQCPTNSKTVAGYTLCAPCHYSCTSCTQGYSASTCQGCVIDSYRANAPVPAGNGKCDCLTGFVDVEVPLCQPCNSTLYGCIACSSPTVCTACDTSTFMLSGTVCTCITSTYMASGYCLTYPGCLIAVSYNNIISCRSCDSARNFIPVASNSTCTCQIGFHYNSTTDYCEDTCGDNITAYGKCDMGPNNTENGCDANCNIENGYHCIYNISASGIPGISTCFLKEIMTLTYLYSQREPGSHSFTMAFGLSPAMSNLTQGSFVNNFDFQTMPITDETITFDPSTSTIYLKGVYTQDLQNKDQGVTVSFKNMYFYADPITLYFTPTGLNAELIIDKYATSNVILSYLFLGQGLIAILVAIFASIVGLKLVGIELLVPIQLIYFTLATIPAESTYNTALANLKYANGFNNIVSYSYFRTYSQNKSLIAMKYETEFLLSTNIMLGAYILILIWLLIHHLRLKFKEYKLESFLQANDIKTLPQQNSVDSQDQQQDEQKMKLKKKKRTMKSAHQQKEQSDLREDHHRSFKVFSFEVDRVYFIFYLILINQMMFGFIVMTLNVPITTFNFPEEISVLVCNFIFFIFIGNIVFISYDQQSNKMIAFTCVKDRYAYIYVLLDFIIITTLSMTFQEEFSTYATAALSLGFVILVVKQKPYNSVFLTLENVVAFYLQVMLVLCQVILCVLHNNKGQNTISFICTLIIASLIALGEFLTIVRVIAKVNFKKAFDDLKDPHKDDDKDEKHKKVIEKNLDLLEQDKNISIVPPESVRNGLFAPKQRMIDWQSKNSQEYESVRERDQDSNQQEQQEQHPNQQQRQEQEQSEHKQEKLNELQILKKRLRNNLKQKKEQDTVKKGN